MSTAQLVQPYLSFEGRCDEALKFYESALGAKIGMVSRFKDMPPGGATGEGCGEGPSTPPPGDNVMHAELTVGATTFFATDGMSSGKASFKGISLSLSFADVASCERCFNALAAGGQVMMPLSATFFAKSFGMVADKFGVPWMVIVHQPM